MQRIFLGLAGAMLAATLAYAQTPSPGGTDSTTGTGTGTGTSMGAPATQNPAGQKYDTGKASASGDDNQAVVTTGTNADQPAKGKNSFTRHEAKKRITAKGYSGVANLKKDADGVWRGTATKDGQSVQVWLDYKGNVGQQS
jgi:hypothetical protein